MDISEARKDSMGETPRAGETPTRAGTAALAGRLAALAHLSHADLRGEWRRLYRAQPPKKLGRDMLELGVAWKLQEQTLGGLSAASRRRLADVAAVLDKKGDLGLARVARLRPGARLVREWRGQTHEVLVSDQGFHWRGKTWRSLSVIAREITGTQWPGPRFFGLAAKTARAGGARVEAADG